MRGPVAGLCPCLNGGDTPSFTYHRFWAQADIALAMGSYAQPFGGWFPELTQK
jgi:hypothetical protein